MKERGKRTPRVCRERVVLVPAPQKEKKPLRPAQCRPHMKKELAHNFREIVSGLVEHAKAGSLQHIKLATELLGVGPEEKEKVKRRGPGPLTRVLREIERRDAAKKKASSGTN